MSKIKVNEVTNLGMDGPVYFPNGIIGDGSQMILAPGVETFSPTNLSTNNALDGVIQIGYNQPIVFSGIGTITIRAGAVDGTIHEEFTCGVSTRATIAGNVLSIDPATDYDFGVTYFVSIPSPGIANTSGGFASSITGYQFTCRPTDYTGDGGDYVFTAYDSSSPTNYYKYHIFTNPGIYTSASPSQNADGFGLMLIGGGGAGGMAYYPGGPDHGPNQFNFNAGGGGAGGIIKYDSGPEANLPPGSFPIVVGTGGSSVDSIVNFPQNMGIRGRQEPRGMSGQNTVMVVSPTVSFTAEGGGSGGMANGYSKSDPYAPSPTPSLYDYQGYSGGSGGGSAGSGENNPVAGGIGNALQGNPGGGYVSYRSPSPYPNLHYVAGGGGGAGSNGGNGLRYPGPYPTQYIRSGQGGDGLQVPTFPGPTIMSRIPFGPQILPRMQGNYYAGGGSASWRMGYHNPAPYVIGNRGGYGGGGTAGYSPWDTASTYPTVPNLPNPGLPSNGAAVIGGGGAAGNWRGITNPRNSYPIDTHPTQRYYSERFSGNGGSGSVMIKYAHPGS
jgi:hypothetical protein